MAGSADLHPGQPGVPRPRACVLHGCLADQAAATPDALAVRDSEGDLTFAGLDRHSSWLANRLLASGVTPGGAVGILMDRSAVWSIGVLGALKAGCAYVPLDPWQDVGRLAGELDVARVTAVVADRNVAEGGLLGHPVLGGLPWLLVPSTPGAGPDTDPGLAARPLATACVVVTSGPAGTPVGIELTHEGILTMVTDDRWRTGRQRRVLMHGPPSAGTSIYELWVPLLSGGAVIVAPVGDEDPHSLADLATQHLITSSFLDAGLLSQVAQQAPAFFGGLAELVTSGDVSAATLWSVRSARPDLPVRTVLGTAETTLWALTYDVPAADIDADPPLGRPFPGTRAYVLDASLSLVPVGAVGELYVTGMAVAQGYRGQPAATATRFVADPFAATATRMYRTGELVRWSADGELHMERRCAEEASRPAEPAEPLSDRAASAQEKVLCEIFGEVLGVSGISVDDDFFDLGGHSLLATRLVSRIRAMLGVELTVSDIFDAPTASGLARLLTRGGGVRPPAGPVARPDRIPLSFGQLRLWFLAKFEDATTAHNVPLAFRLSGPLVIAALEAALADLARRHESLRTIFPEDGGVARQVIVEPSQARPALRVSAVERAGLDAALLAALDQPFDLATEIPLRADLFVLGNEEHALLLTLHHIACDGWSWTPLLQDLATAYASRRSGREPDEPPLPLQYADYALWQRQFLGDLADPDSLMARQLAFWRQALTGLPEQLRLPTDRPRPARSGRRGGLVPLRIDPELHQDLIALARRCQASLFMVLQAALVVLLHRMGAGTDIPIGTAVAGRTDVAFDGLIGFFVNTVVLRGDVSGDQTFHDVVAGIRRTDLSAFRHQDLPFERLVEQMAPARSLSRHPLFQVMLILQNNRRPALELDGIKATPLDVDLDEPPADLDGQATYIEHQYERLDLTFVFSEPDEADEACGIRGLVNYSADLFDRRTVEALTVRLLQVLAGVVADPELPVRQLEVLTPQERRQFLAPGAEPGPLATLPELFEAQVVRTPERVALADGRTQLTYAELNAQANRLARLLIARGAGPERIVGISTVTSIPMIVAVLAVAKAGAAYLGLDPDEPAARLQRVLEASAPVLVLGAGEHAARLSAGSVPFLALDGVEVLSALEVGQGHNPLTATNPLDRDLIWPLSVHNAAFVVYTSGSTGTPRGIVITHAGIAAMARGLRAGPAERVLQLGSLRFGAAFSQISAALLHGGTLVLPAPGLVLGEELHQLLAEHAITWVMTTPSVIATLPRDGLTALRHLYVGGEACPPDLAARWSPGRTMINTYGPAETTVYATSSEPLSEGLVVPIGRPLADVRAYVLDACLSLVPPGVVGALYLAGPGLARGYLSAAAATAERFVANPWGPPGTRMYRTGDLARWGRGGLECVGRSDSQVKIRGCPVDMGEVEAALLACPGIAKAAVVALEEQPGDVRLVAYVVPESGGPASVAEIRGLLAARLPGYMVPAAFVELAEMPLNGWSMVDYARLPAPGPIAAVPGRGPLTAQEETLCGIFSEVLGIEVTGAEANFFDLGGHSLLAAQCISRIRSVLGADVTLPDLFEAPSVAALAARLGSHAGSRSSPRVLALRSAGRWQPLFCVHPGSGLGWCYAGLARHLPDVPLYSIQAEGVDGPAALPESLDAMAESYITHVRSVQPSGPYQLLGWSFGGNVAHIMASRLRERGERVALLAMLDAAPYSMLRAQPDGAPPRASQRRWSDAELDAILREEHDSWSSFGAQQRQAILRVFRNNVRLLQEAEPAVFDGDLLYVAAGASPAADGESMARGWQRYVTGVIKDHSLDSTHAALLRPDMLPAIARLVQPCLDRGDQS